MTITAPEALTLQRVIEEGAVRSVFQPIVDIDTLEPVAYEALARGPEGTAYEAPGDLFGAAYAEGLVCELDWACRRAAYEAALGAGLGPQATLFVNVEPATLGRPAPASVSFAQARALQGLRVVLEVTERAITAKPAELLASAHWARAHGWGVALDDVGADPGSLALLPLLGPDVVKLDLRLVQDRPDREVAAIMTAVSAHAERSGAAVLAEGVETVEHLRAARAMGARYAQGYLFGRPGELGPSAAAARPVALLAPAGLPAAGHTPFEVVAAHRPVRPSTKPMLVEMARHLEEEAAAQATPAVILSVFQDAAHFTRATAVRYHTLAGRCALVVALGVGLPPEPVPGVRGADLAEGDPLADEWSVVVVGAHYAAALVARDLGDRGPEHTRRFDYALTHDRPLVVDAAATLLRRTLAH